MKGQTFSQDFVPRITNHWVSPAMTISLKTLELCLSMYWSTFTAQVPKPLTRRVYRNNLPNCSFMKIKLLLFQMRIICKRNHTEDAAVSHKFCEIQIALSPCFFSPGESTELLVALIRRKTQVTPSHYQTLLASKHKIITNLSSATCSEFGFFKFPLIWKERCMGNSVLYLEWGSVFTSTLNKVIEVSSRVKEWKANRKCLRSSGKL